MDAPAKRTKRKVVEVRRSSIQGRGVFALVDFARGDRIIEYLGERLSSQAANERYSDDDAVDHHHTFLFTVNDDIVIDARRQGNAARFINHSCEPNCEAEVENGRIFIYAKKKIRPGTELSYDYWYTTDEAYTDEDLRRIYPCCCGSSKCRGTLAAPHEETARKPPAADAKRGAPGRKKNERKNEKKRTTAAGR
jgi:SET domain-containing protein